jgi:UDP-glucose 4-epimerase
MIELAGRGSYRLIPFPEERKKIDIGDFYADTAKIKAALGWQPATGLREGLARTIAYYDAHQEHYL